VKEKSFLIVDDNREWADLISKLLEQKGYRVSYTDSGEGCFKNLERLIPDILILDVVLPDISGYEICSRVKSDSRFNEVIIIMSGTKIKPEDFAFGKNLGADAYFSKPMQNKEFLVRIENLIHLKDLEEEKEKLKVNFDFIFANTKDILFALDINGYITSINDVIEKHTGRKSKEFIAKQFVNFVAKADREEWEKFSLSNQSGNYTPPQKFSFENKSAEKNVVLEITLSPVYEKEIYSGALGLARVLESVKNHNEETNKHSEESPEEKSFNEISKQSSGNTAVIYNNKPLKEYASGHFEKLKSEYAAALEKSIEERFYKVEVKSIGILKDMSAELGSLKAGPGDIIDIHKDVIENKTENSPSEKINLYYEEGRLILIKLMGNLINFYKNYYIN